MLFYQVSWGARSSGWCRILPRDAHWSANRIANPVVAAGIREPHRGSVVLVTWLPLFMRREMRAERTAGFDHAAASESVKSDYSPPRSSDRTALSRGSISLSTTSLTIAWSVSK